MNCSPPGSSVHGIFQARRLEWVVISSSRGSFQTHVFCISCIGRWILYHWAAQASPKHSGGAQSGQLINIKAISLPPSLSTEGTISPTPFQNTLELSACPDRWEMSKGFAGILVPFLPVSYHNSPIWGPLPPMYTILPLWEQSALLFHIGCLPPCLQHFSQFCSLDYFLQLPGQLPICNLGLIFIPPSLQLSYHLLQCTKCSDGPWSTSHHVSTPYCPMPHWAQSHLELIHIVEWRPLKSDLRDEKN